ncbi:PD-(D/E)XK nuclease family protein [Candidatus Woesearchaeota archaeon]|nr:PD-(D/E)XK nuclease family protein [Candidatus Woesearchaeota archaeon]
MALHGRRVESPSSINTYKQCPRKYYYQYVEKLPTGTSIHLIRGGVVHKALEDFFEADLSDPVTHDYRFLHARLQSLFRKYWLRNEERLSSLGLAPEELDQYRDESVVMLQAWFSRFKARMQKRVEKRGVSFPEAFAHLKPRREEEYLSEEFMVRGFIDAIHELDGKVVVLDYKTSKNGYITPEYKLQLAIYALLYEERHGVRPDFVGIDFLKSVEQVLKVDEELLNQAKFELEQIHASTSSEGIDDYPLRPGPLCKWRTGQCDYYDLCFGGVSVEEFRKRKR